MAQRETSQKRSLRYVRELKKGKNELTGKPLRKGQRIFRWGVLNERKRRAYALRRSRRHEYKKATASK